MLRQLVLIGRLVSPFYRSELNGSLKQEWPALAVTLGNGRPPRPRPAGMKILRDRGQKYVLLLRKPDEMALLVYLLQSYSVLRLQQCVRCVVEEHLQKTILRPL